MADPKAEPKSRPTTYNILFVCTGNTCRSPMAMAIARRAVEERGWSHVAVESAGIAAEPGRPAAEHAAAVASEHGLDLAEHASSPLTPDRIEWADLILVMGPSHLAAVAERGGGEKVALLTDFAASEDVGRPIADPFGGDETAYRRAFDELDAAIRRVLDELEVVLSP